MSDRAKEALSVVRREEENNERDADYGAQAQDWNDNAELPGNNDAADWADGTAVGEHGQNAENLAEVGADRGYTIRTEMKMRPVLLEYFQGRKYV